jgi:A/G-specific adenine glycosylase
MLHRTQAPQVVPIYAKFVESYQDVSALAHARKKDLHSMLYSLGLRWRIDLIHAMSVNLTRQFGGRIPRTKVDLLSLPGVSEYIASAVRCFAWNEPEPLIDTNTVRVVGRVFGLEIKDSSRRNRLFRELIAFLVDPNEPRAYNYALLDLADQVCMKKRAPECEKCPIQKYCVYGTTALAHQGIT